ncbi:MAG: bifunctional phosphopantothenoylcysteine decarboxylase/phosphopantothenate--cysteine ligase CoaBC [Nitrososphaerales archaeon]
MSDSIRFTKGRDLEGKRITLCVTGSVACILAPELARELIRYGAQVYSVVTKAARRFIRPTLLEWATGNKVVTKLTGKLEHLDLGEKSDLVLVYPATANTISKFAHGIEDSPVTSILNVALGAKCPIMMAPAMHLSLFNNPILKQNMDKLKDLGVHFIEPELMEEKAKAPMEKTLSSIIKFFNSPLKGLNLLITAGASAEPIDDVRIITNRSSGKMGIELASEALLRRANVTLIYGRVSVDIPKGCKAIKAESTEEMLKEIREEITKGDYHVMIFAGAPSDYRLEEPYKGKIDSREKERLNITLVRTPKILEEVRKIKENIKLVSFKAEYNLSDEELINRAKEFMLLTRSDLVIANDVSRPQAGFEKDTNEVIILDSSDKVKKVKGSKKFVASKILDSIEELLASLKS